MNQSFIEQVEFYQKKRNHSDDENRLSLQPLNQVEAQYSLEQFMNREEIKPGKQFQDLYLFDRPVGKGCFYIKYKVNNLTKGTTTEVFQVTHFKSGLLRTSKIIRQTNRNDLTDLINEVRILKKLVLLFYKNSNFNRTLTKIS